MEQDYIKAQVDSKIMEIDSNNNVFDVGVVVNVKDFIIEVTGLENVMFYERVEIGNKAFGYVCNLGENVVTVALLKIKEAINIGDSVHSSNKIYTGSYSLSSFGRIIDIFGEDKLTGKTFTNLVDVPIERKTIPIMDRGIVNRPLLTGIAGIDLMYPIGKGQRQLIIGDKRTGKTQIVLDTIVNQKDKNVLCFYVAIGKTKKEVKNIYSEFVKRGAIAYTTIITAFNDELPPVISLTPYFALSVAEEYMMNGYDVLVCIDDLKRHAEAYREISLISGKKPARDAYPADIFYTHSRLLEKGCQYKDGGSVTILPIVETKGGDITDYISTNIISITDGQIVLSANSFQKGEKPAINYGLSVSRLGGAVQNPDMKKVGSRVRQKLLSYLETRSVYELVNVDDMSPELRNQFTEGKVILSSLSQYKFSPKTEEEMISTFNDILENSNKPSASTNNDNVENASTSDTSEEVVEDTSTPDTVEDNLEDTTSLDIVDGDAENTTSLDIVEDDAENTTSLDTVEDDVESTISLDTVEDDAENTTSLDIVEDDAENTTSLNIVEGEVENLSSIDIGEDVENTPSLDTVDGEVENLSSMDIVENVENTPSLDTVDGEVENLSSMDIVENVENTPSLDTIENNFMNVSSLNVSEEGFDDISLLNVGYDGFDGVSSLNNIVEEGVVNDSSSNSVEDKNVIETINVEPGEEFLEIKPDDSFSEKSDK